jgi:hypothetical protein
MFMWIVPDGLFTPRKTRSTQRVCPTMYEHRHDNIAGICNQKIDFEPSNVTMNAQIPMDSYSQLIFFSSGFVCSTVYDVDPQSPSFVPHE